MSGVYTQQPIAAVNKSGFQDTKRWQFEGNAKLEYDFGSIKALEGLKAAVHVAYDYSNTGNRNMLQSYQLMSFSPTTMNSMSTAASTNRRRSETDSPFARR